MPSFKSMTTVLASFLRIFFDFAAALLPLEPKRSWWREPYLMRDAIGRYSDERRDHQGPSRAIKSHQEAIKRPPRAIKSHQEIKRHQAPSGAVPDAKPVLDDDVREPLLIHEDECLPNKATSDHRRESVVCCGSQGLSCPKGDRN